MTLAPQMALELIDAVGSRFMPGSRDGLPDFRFWVADGRLMTFRPLALSCTLLGFHFLPVVSLRGGAGAGGTRPGLPDAGAMPRRVTPAPESSPAGGIMLASIAAAAFTLLSIRWRPSQVPWRWSSLAASALWPQ